MRKLILLLLMALFMVITAFSAETSQKEFNVSKGQSLDVNLKVGGSLSITGWEKEKVGVIVHFKKTTPDQWDIRFTEKEGRIEIGADYKGDAPHFSNPEFEIQVPNQFDLKLKTMGGDIDIRHVSGEITGKTMGGNLKLAYLKGIIDLRTMGGDITLKDSDVDGKLKTMGGRVLFENVIGDIQGSSMGGNVIYNNVKPREGRTPNNKDKLDKVSTMGGDINLSDAPYGADVDTMGGNIHIKSAGNYVKAKTMGGNITVDAIDGGIKATTMGGNITVIMTGDPQKGDREVNLDSMGGNITLSVPGELSMDIDIELGYTNDGKYNIVSDFQLKLEKVDSGNNTGKKYIYGKAQIGGGKHKIKIKTINGDIYLKKSK